MAKRKKEKWAYRHWAMLMKSVGNPKHSDEVFHELVKCYGEAHRAYHTLNHVVSMLNELELLGERTPALALAIWFHDAVYDTHTRDSEERSAALAKRLIEKLELSSELGEEVSDLVLTTKFTATPVTRLAQILSDLDLMIFGKPNVEFDAYDTNIRFEYSWIPFSDYGAARKRVLQSFLDRPKIYYTETLVEKYEQAARENLVRAIGKL